MNRSALFVLLRAARDWRPFWVAIAVSAAAGLLLGRTNVTVSTFLGYYGPPALAITLIGGLVEYSQRGSVWMLVAQRPGMESRRLWSIVAFAAALYLAASATLMLGVLGGIALNADAPQELTRSSVVVFPLWVVMVGFAVAFTSTLSRTRTAALSVGWIISPLVLELIQGSLGFSLSIQHAIEFLLPPFNAVFQFGAVLRGDRAEHALRYTLQLISFPILCLAVLHWRINSLAKPDRIRIE